MFIAPTPASLPAGVGPHADRPVEPRVDPGPSEPSGWRVAFLDAGTWPAVVLVGVVGLGLLIGAPRVWGLAIAGAIGWTLERLWRRHDQPVLRRGLRADVIHLLVTNLLSGAALLTAAGICLVLLGWATIPATQAWITGQPLLVQAGLGFVLFSFVLYWQHRLAHAVPFLWRFHAVHHSSEHLDWLAAARLHPLEFFFGGFLLAPPFILLGFDPVSLGAFSALTTAWAVVEHANVGWRLRWMDRIYPNPEYHHWHHSSEPEARDKNFGMPLWDAVFGTYFMPGDRRPSRYGIAEPMPTTFLGQLAQPLRRRRPAPDPAG